MIKLNVKYLDCNISEFYKIENLKCEDWINDAQYTTRDMTDEEMKMYIINSINKKELILAINIHNEPEYICSWNIKSFRFE